MGHRQQEGPQGGLQREGFVGGVVAEKPEPLQVQDLRLKLGHLNCRGHDAGHVNGLSPVV